MHMIRAMIETERGDANGVGHDQATHMVGTMIVKKRKYRAMHMVGTMIK
jgi:hypothetical protein